MSKTTFDSFAALAKAIHAEDVRKANNLRRTLAMRQAAKAKRANAQKASA